MPIELSIVIPCLNEERTLPLVFAEIRSAFTSIDYEYEVIVADNGSTDNSCKISEDFGVRTISVREKGYGRALREGIDAAKGRLILIGDADHTYSFKDGYELVEKMHHSNNDMIIGTRFMGTIEDGAMPFSHRYFGTPLLTVFINLAFAAKLTDSNSGLRVFKKAVYEQWKPESVGMEFASEMIIKCLKSKSKIDEIPIVLRKGNIDRVSHLRTWRDGMRNVLLILSEIFKQRYLCHSLRNLSTILSECVKRIF